PFTLPFALTLPIACHATLPRSVDLFNRRSSGAIVLPVNGRGAAFAAIYDFFTQFGLPISKYVL
ncbi:MAG: hypothetical protein ACK5QX_12400, partial [bacterium]